MENMVLNAQQSTAVEFPGSVTVISGAGTGKTRVITERVRKILRERDLEDHIAALTFTNRAAREMRRRTGYEQNLFLGTFHSFGRMLLNEFPQHAGLTRGFAILDTSDQVGLVRRITGEEFNFQFADARTIFRTIVNGINVLKVNKQASLSDSFFSKLPFHDDVFYEIVELYSKTMKQENKVDFNDLLMMPIEIMKQDTKVRLELANRHRYILVDELQDIDRHQLEMLRQLRTEKSVYFGVGDDDQSIYSFRGANPQLMRMFSEEFTSKHVVRLERNYRSTEGILRLANEIIRGNPGRHAKELTSDGLAGELPELKRYDSDEAEARGVARQIDSLLAESSPSQIAVLYRNNAMSNLVESSLASFQIPYRVRGGMRFFERAEVKDLLAYLQVSQNPSDIAALMRSINSPKRGVGDVTKQKIQDAVSVGSDVWEEVCASSHPGIQAYRLIIAKIQAARDIDQKVSIAVEASGFLQALDDSGQDNLGELINVPKRFIAENGTEASLADFLSACVLDSVEEVTQETVTLLTIHSAKGLEFDHVFIIGLEDEILPGKSPSNEDVAEDCRVLYVAATRAGKSLRLSYAGRRFMWGRLVYPRMTRYLRGPSRNSKLLECEGQEGGLISRRSRSQKRYKPKRAPEVRQEVNGLTVGMKVVSPKFGPGVILRFEGEDDKAKANVLFFTDHKQRWLVMKMAKLGPL